MPRFVAGQCCFRPTNPLGVGPVLLNLLDSESGGILTNAQALSHPFGCYPCITLLLCVLPRAGRKPSRCTQPEWASGADAINVNLEDRPTDGGSDNQNPRHTSPFRGPWASLRNDIVLQLCLNDHTSIPECDKRDCDLFMDSNRSKHCILCAPWSLDLEWPGHSEQLH